MSLNMQPTKGHLANERTYLEWVEMAVILGSVATGLLALEWSASASSPPPPAPLNSGALPKSPASPGARTPTSFGYVLAPVSIAFAVYSIYLFLTRRKLIREEDFQNSAFKETRGSVALTLMLISTLTLVFLMELFGIQAKI